MDYQQLIQTNLAAVGYPDYCLAYVEQVFGIHNDNDPDAWQGWLNTKSKHTGAIPPTNISVPVWFSWTGTVGGVTQNWGHVAVSTPQGVYTNPLSGSGHKVFPSIEALATAYGVHYVGWSEDLGVNKIVGEEMEIFNEGDRFNFNMILYGADKGFHKDLIGKEFKAAMYLLKDSSDFRAWHYLNSGDFFNHVGHQPTTAEKQEFGMDGSGIGTMTHKDAWYKLQQEGKLSGLNPTNLAPGIYKVN